MTKTTNRSYDLEERTARLGEQIIRYCKKLPQKSMTNIIMHQLIRSATSVGANYMEANGASSKKDFKNKIYICRKEVAETKHWLRMMAACLPEERDDLKPLWLECQELTLIFQKILSTLKVKN